MQFRDGPAAVTNRSIARSVTSSLLFCHCLAGSLSRESARREGLDGDGLEVRRPTERLGHQCILLGGMVGQGPVSISLHLTLSIQTMPLESVLFSIAQGFLWPVTLLVLAAFAFSLMSLGGFVVEWYKRAKEPGKPLILPLDPTRSIESLELLILRELEGLRLCSRIAPMLGLVATMIPMGPALISASSGASQGVAQNLAPAFAAVIIALVSASITFWIHTVRRRWLLTELHQLLEQRS